eukprot:1141642-Pelagomonas_calceolata.AAC.5
MPSNLQPNPTTMLSRSWQSLPTPNMPSNLTIQAVGTCGEKATGRAAYRGVRRKPGRVTDNLPDLHLFGCS